MTDRERRFWQIEKLLKEEYDEAGKAEYSKETVQRLTLALQAKEKLDKLAGVEV